jgi:hypothetical protein
MVAWADFDAQRRQRLSNDYDAGFNQLNGQTNLSYYQNNADWGAVGNSLGLEINSMNNLNAVFDYVGANKKKGKKNVSASGGGAGGIQNSNSGASYSTATAFDPGRPFVPGTPGSPAVAAVEAVEGVEGREAVAAQNPQSNVGMSTAARGTYSWMGAGDFDGNPGNWGAKDLIMAYEAGYTEQDVENYLRQGSTNFLPEGSGYRALREAKNKISTQFVGRQYHPDWTQDYASGGPAYMFGDADLLGNRKAGWSDAEILNYLDENPQVLNPNNRPGVPGGIYERLNANRFVEGVEGIDAVEAVAAVDAIPAVEAIDAIEAIPARNLLIGNSTLGNAGYAQAVAPNRSEGSRSTRSSYGTSQFNRNNFGKKKRSPISTNGLNI